VAVVKLGVFAASSLGLVWLAVQFVDLILRLANYVSAFAQFQVGGSDTPSVE